MSVVAMSEGAFIAKAVASANEKIVVAINELEKKLPENDDNLPVKHVTKGKITVKAKGTMIWWTKVAEAVCYRLTLQVQDSSMRENDSFDEIDIIEKNRSCCYHIFEGLPKSGREAAYIKFKVRVEAEGRDGKVIATAELTL